MGTGQSEIRIKTGNPLDVDGVVSNIGTNKAELAAMAANIDGKDTYPQSVSTQRLQVAQTLSIGDQVQLTDGCVKSNHITTGSAVITESVQIGNTLVTSDKMSVSSLSSMSANLGTITGGSLSIAAGGGVTIGSTSAGIAISENQIFCKVGGATKILIDGATGTITASKFALTAESGSTIDLRNATGYFSTGIVVGSTTLGGIDSTATTAQSTANTANSTANTALTTAQGRIAPGGGVTVDANKYITRISVNSGITISTASSDSGARTNITSAGMAIYNAAGTVAVQADHTSGLWINNITSTPGVTERASVAFGGAEKAWFGGWNTGACVGCAGTLQIGSTTSTIAQTDYVSFVCGGNTVGLWSSTGLTIGTAGNPIITAGSAPTQGSSAGSLPIGTIKMGTGGSLWVVNGSSQWDRIRTYTYNP